jgi:hypothetical protein
MFSPSDSPYETKIGGDDFFTATRLALHGIMWAVETEGKKV